MAVVIVHHTRKGVVTPGDADAARVASSIVSAARIVLTVTGMTAEDEKAFGLPAGSRNSYFRVDGGKSNYARLTEAEWFERQPYTLENEDVVATVAPWFPPVDRITSAAMGIVEAGITQGSQYGPWSSQLRNTERSIKNLLISAGITTSSGQKEAIETLFRAGFKDENYMGKDRKFVKGLRSPDGRPVGFDWERLIVH